MITGRNAELPASGINTPTFQRPEKSKTCRELSDEAENYMLAEVSTCLLR